MLPEPVARRMPRPFSHPLSPWVACLLAHVLAACSAASDSALPGPRPPVLMITIDTLRADHLGCYGYSPYAEPVSPAIDAFARQGVRFEQCFVPRGQTAPSLCSLMVGKYPSMHGVRENGQPFAGTQTTLSERMSALGYRTSAFLSRLPASPLGHPAQGTDELVSGKKKRLVQQADSDAFVTSKAIEWLSSRSPDDERPFFCWVHLYDVHQPYTPPPPFDRLFTGDYAGPLLGRQGQPDWRKIDTRLGHAAVTETPLDPADHRYVIGLYDGGVRAADSLVGKLLETLDARGLAEETLVILTADHGEELADHGAYYYHGNSIYDGTLRVPWIVRWPGRLPVDTTFEPLVQSLDLVPTLLTWLGEDVPDELEGVSLARSLASDDPAPPRQHVYSEWQDLIWTVRDAEHKYVLNPRGAHPKKPPFERFQRGFRLHCEELYGIDEDPTESVDRLLDRPLVRDSMRAQLLQFRGRPGGLTGWSVHEDAAVAENLASLGYVGTDEERTDVLIGAESCESERR
ncbi:MAG: arylsulfatase A-like enzyme [Chlamydiales bacterium]|jgi:arylsulfatase A-like enzyme